MPLAVRLVHAVAHAYGFVLLLVGTDGGVHRNLLRNCLEKSGLPYPGIGIWWLAGMWVVC